MASDDLNLKDVLIGLGGALPLFLPLELVGQGGMALIAGAGAGILSYVYADEIRAFMKHRVPVLQQDPKALKAWLMSRGDVSFPEPRQIAQRDEVAQGDEPMYIPSERVPEPAREEQQSVSTEPIFPRYPDEQMLHLGYVANTRRRFDPHLNMPLGKGVLLAGSQGVGKSNIIGLVAQSAGQCGMPWLIVDYKGEFYPLRDVVPNGIMAGHPSYSDIAGPGFYPLTVENASEFAAIIMEGPVQVVLDVPSYNGNNDEVAQVIAALLHGLMDYSRDVMRKGESPWPCLVITDEAHNFLPQAQKLSALKMQDSESFGILASAYSRMANTGRSFGYTLVMATQRLPNIAKWAIANLQIKIIMAHALKNDLDACEEETGGLVDREEIKALANGTGVVIGLTREPLVVKFDKQKARHVSNTPQIEHLRKAPQTQTIPTTSLLPDLPMKEQIEVQPPVTQPPGPPQRRITDLERALAAWNEGHQSVTKLEKALDVTHHRAYELYRDLKARRLI